jgi:beta-galactosidase
LPETFWGHTTDIPAVPRVAATASAAVAAPVVRDSADAVVISGKNFSATFSKKTGALASLIYDGTEILAAADGGPVLNAFRAPADNDKWAANNWFSNGLHNLRHGVTSFDINTSDPNSVRITTRIRSQGAEGVRYNNPTGGTRALSHPRPLGEKDLAFETTTTWRISGDGTLHSENTIHSTGPDIVLPRVGFQLFINPTLQRVVWFGRGPGENYRDRYEGSWIGRFTGNIPEMFVSYIRPQEMGNREQVRWLTLTNAAGNSGALFRAKGQMSFSALPWTPQELLSAPHVKDLPSSSRIVLSLDAATLGLGGASCGPGPLSRDIIKSGTDYSFGYSISPVPPGGPGGNPGAADDPR